MAADITDKFNKASNGTRPDPAALTAQKGIGAASITVDSTAGWATDTAVHFTIYQVNGNGEKVVGTQTDWKGIVSSSTSITSLTLQAGTDQVYPIGSKVIATPTAAWADDLAEALLASHAQTGAIDAQSVASFREHIDVVDGKAIRDGNDNELIKFSQTASAVNEITVANAATGGNPTISVTGGDTNAGLVIKAKGTGQVMLGRPVAFSAYLSGAFATGGTSPVKVPLDTEDYDDGSNFNTTTGQFTAPYNGRYHFSGAVTITNTGGQVANCSIYVNGVERKRGLQINSPAASHTQLYNVASDISLTAGDTVELYTTTATTSRSLFVGSAFTYLSGHLIGRTD